MSLIYKNKDIDLIWDIRLWMFNQRALVKLKPESWVGTSH